MHICFLDIDGTLVSTAGAGQAAFAVTLEKDFGITGVTTSGVAFAGRSDRAIALDLFALYGIDPTPEVWSKFNVGYIKRLEEVLPTHDGCVLPGVVPLLEMLAARGDIATGLLTGNVREAARRKLQHYGLWDWFAFGGFGDEHTERCDIAAMALAAARSHLNGDSPKNGDTRHGQMVVIGDTLNDISCGRSIGARCVAVPTGKTSAATLRSGNPDVLVDTLEESAAIMELFDE
jgi:phosphoglycolate phosphatase-like HAD superfamily hydrolase